MSKQEKAFKLITEKIVSLLEEGVIPWQKPFDVDDAPRNGFTGDAYSGVNSWFLHLLSFDEPFFVGYKQAEKLGGNVKKGQSGLPILFPKFNRMDTETGDYLSEKKAEKLVKAHGSERVKRFISYSCGYVWNISQCENIDREKLPERSDKPGLAFEPITQCEQIWGNWSDRPEVFHKGSKARYMRERDIILLPERKFFQSEVEYYGVLFHEGIHATGSPDRLERTKGKEFGDKDYSFEELIAEFGSAYLCGQAGIDKPVIENKAAYIKNWLLALKEEDNTDWIVSACAQAREAAEYIISGGSSQKEEFKKAS